MATTITLKNVPDAVYERLRKAADAHRRSINGEAIHCLERVLAPTPLTAEERLERARRLRSGLGATRFDPGDIAGAIKKDRA